MWVYVHQYDPFALNLAETSNTTSKEGPIGTTLGSTASKHVIDINEFHETTTSRYGTSGTFGGGDGNDVKYSKLSYAFREFQQEVENSCGRKYYSDYLSGYSLTITASVFGNR